MNLSDCQFEEQKKYRNAQIDGTSLSISLMNSEHFFLKPYFYLAKML